jgi:hypothetical protein
VLLAGLAGPLSAQLSTGGVQKDRIIEPREEIEAAIAESRFHLASVRLSPEFSIREATYDNNVYGSVDNPKGDFRTVLSAGLGLILPVTSNVFLRAGLYPEYTWYAELKERRFFGGRYDASVLLFLNRLTIEGNGRVAREDVIYSSEQQGRVVRNVGTAKLGAEFRLLTRLFIYGEGQIQRFRFTGQGSDAGNFDPSATDQTSRVVRAELRYRFSESVRLGAGYEQTRSEFLATAQQYDNSTRAVIGTIYYDRQRVFLRVSGGYREGKPLNGSTFPPFSGVTGSASAAYSVLRQLELRASASRDLRVGLTSPYYLETRFQGGLALRAGWRLVLQGFVGFGTDSYATPFLLPGGQLGDRKDDVLNYGGELDLALASRIQMRFGATEDRYDSNVPSYNRSFFRWFVSLNLGGNLLR